MKNPFRYFNSSPQIIRLTVMMYIRYPLSLRQVDDLLFERGIDICHETVRFWWNRFSGMSAPGYEQSHQSASRNVHYRVQSRHHATTGAWSATSGIGIRALTDRPLSGL